MKKPTKNCPVCSTFISTSNYDRHIKVCKGPKKHLVKEEYKISDNLYQCPECDKVGSKKALTMHIWIHENGPLPKNKNYVSGFTEFHRQLKSGERHAWNKGLSFKTHPHLSKSLRAGGITTGEKIKNKEIPYTLSEMWRTPERRKQKSEWRKQLHITNPESHPNRRLANNRNKMSYPEQLVFNFLTQNNISFEHNKKVGKYYPDFTIGTLILEIDGAQWHDPQKDAIRDQTLQELGYIVVRFSVDKKLVEKVEVFLKQQKIL